MNPSTLESKKQVVSKISESFKGASTMVIVEYRGLTVADLSELRKSLKAVKASFNVYKNTLVQRASDELGYNELDQYLSGSNAYVFSEDVVEGPKVLAKFAKKNENLVIKAGLVEGKVVDAAGVKAVATMPNREGLISMFLSCLQAPIRSFACTVKAVADSKN
ncbi:MAG: 50S ribosomal protein L10 [Bacilli bacterium]|jgi:large subunit ribosomal protein L10|nr:50S ribosomal protein L10 [Bacilli bacterium]MBR0193947.1 50S ribosomal protein L10 [Bacilli bacterium]MBR0301687.1 50S ribosomal protein L10 [Bacilli bacterium]MDY6276742.1 50S ribosomal protein L10 [Bacilli bacterium]MDY6362899.1 50S ribosomal protein L10 [Bacilli bacterium]